MNSILAKKIEQGQKFLENGMRIPVTKLDVDGNVVAAIKTQDRDLHSAVQLGFEKREKSKAKSAKSIYRFLKEVRLPNNETVLPAVGDAIKATSILKPGDVVDISGTSKGKGYAGVVKRHHFKGGPKTHGQSDRQRAPGSIGQTTTPGRVYKGKRMAGHMGHEKVTIKNLQVLFVDDKNVLVKGLVPGGRNTLLMLKKVRESKKFVPLFSASEKPSDAVVVREASDEKTVTTEVQKKDVTLKTEAPKIEVKEGAK